jgi:hypothetical protein
MKGRREKGEGRREKGEGRREKGEGRREKGEVRREKGEGRREKGEGRREKGEGRREKGEGRREKGEGRREKGEKKRPHRSPVGSDADGLSDRGVEAGLLIDGQVGDGAVNEDAPVVLGGPQRFAVAAFLKVFGESVRMGVDLNAGRAFANGAFHF